MERKLNIPHDLNIWEADLNLDPNKKTGNSLYLFTHT